MGQSTEHAFLFAGGGTGGHIYPALAIAEELERQLGANIRSGAGGAGGGPGHELALVAPPAAGGAGRADGAGGGPGYELALVAPPAAGGACECRFLCSNRAVDERILSAEGVRFRTLAAAPPSLRPRALWRFLKGWGSSIRAVRREIRDARARVGPSGTVWLIATGGFVAAPAVHGAIAEGCPITLVNLDAVPGLANRYMRVRVSGLAGCRLFTALPIVGGRVGRVGGGETRTTDPYARGGDWQLVSPIVRRAARCELSVGEARRSLGLDPERPVLMVTGASLGARTINDFLARLVREQQGVLSAWQVLHQTGQDDNRELDSAYREAGVRAVVTARVKAMGLWWRSAELAVSRAGAGSVAEAWANGVPTLFLPYPYHKDGHQRANAQALVDARGAIVMEDEIDPESNLASIGPTLTTLLTDAGARRAMREGLATLGPACGAERIAAAILSDLAATRAA